MSSNRPTTNDNIRDLIDARFDSFRLEVKSDMKDLSTQIATLDKTVQANALKQSVTSTKLGMFLAAIGTISGAIAAIIIEKVTGRVS